ncbi:MAG: Uma2 family endonuclease [Isosphaeraceae bacterium]
MATVEALLTAEEFGRRPDPGYPEELVQGRIVSMPPPTPLHGKVRGQAYYLLRRHTDDHDLGHVMSNDSGVITERDPDTVRGADVSFYSYNRLPKGAIPEGYLTFPPDLVVEVRSTDDRWREILDKVTEYLEVGVTAGIVLDPGPRTAHFFRADQPPRQGGSDGGLGASRGQTRGGFAGSDPFCGFR